MKMKRFVAFVLCAVMCLGLFAGCGAKKEQSYVIGFSGPLTGGAAIYGTAVLNSAQMAVDEINAAGGLNGVKFKLIGMDDKHDASNVSTCYASMVEQGMQVSLGTVTTGPALEFKELSKDDNVFFLTPSASGDKVPEYANGYQMCFADGNQGSAAATFVNANFEGQTIGVFYKSDEDYSKGIFEQFMSAKSETVTVVETSFTEANATDFSTQIDTLAEAGCEFIFMPIYYTPAALFMTQAKDKISATATYFGCDGFDGLEGAPGFDINACPQKITMLSHFDSKSTEGKSAEFIKKYTEKFGAETLNQFGASAYDCVYAIYGAMKKAMDEGTKIPANISASDLCEILKKQFNGDYVFTNGATGDSVSWTADGYVNKEAIQFVMKEAG